MPTEIAKTLDANAISFAQTQGNLIETANNTVSGNTFVFVAGFDGTDNTKNDPGYSGDNYRRNDNNRR